METEKGRGAVGDQVIKEEGEQQKQQEQQEPRQSRWMLLGNGSSNYYWTVGFCLVFLALVMTGKAVQCAYEKAHHPVLSSSPSPTALPALPGSPASPPTEEDSESMMQIAVLVPRHMHDRAEEWLREHEMNPIHSVGKFDESEELYYLAEMRRDHRDHLIKTKRGMDHALHLIQEPKQRFKRTRLHSREEQEFYSDPGYTLQWHWKILGMERIWEHQSDVTGKGVLISLVDDGLDFTHPDLKDAFVAEASYDFNALTRDPLPKFADDYHGTRCASEIVAAPDNGYCGVGIANGAQIAGVRMLSGPVTDATEAASLNYAKEMVDIYSNSWGPSDDGRTVEQPGLLVYKALSSGAQYGRNGKGTIYVFASGNGGPEDNCNYDGYANNIYTLTISAYSYSYAKPYYS